MARQATFTEGEKLIKLSVEQRKAHNETLMQQDKLRNIC